MFASEFYVDPLGTTFMCYLYVTVGTISCLCNIMNLIVFLSCREFRQKYLFFIILDLGEMINAIAYITTGFGRLHLLTTGHLTDPHGIKECFFQYPWPVLLILGMELPTFAIAVLAMERICAVAAPVLFKNLFLTQAKWIFVVLIPMISMISLCCAAYSAVTETDQKTSTGHCGIITSTAIWYSTFHFGIIILAYLVSFWSSLFVWYTFKNKSHKTRKLFVILVLVGISALLVSIPSLINIFIRFGLFEMNDLPYALGYALPGFLSIVNSTVSFSLRPELQHQFKVVFLRRAGNTRHLYDSSFTPPHTIANHPHHLMTYESHHHTHHT